MCRCRFILFYFFLLVQAFENVEVPAAVQQQVLCIVAFHSFNGKLLAWRLNARHTIHILSDRLLPAEPGRVIGIQDHLDDRESGKFHETLLPAFYPAPQSSPRPVPHLHRERERLTQREKERGRDYFACSELAVASPRETLSVRGKQLSMHEEKFPSGLCCSYHPSSPPQCPHPTL